MSSRFFFSGPLFFQNFNRIHCFGQPLRISSLNRSVHRMILDIFRYPHWMLMNLLLNLLLLLIFFLIKLKLPRLGQFAPFLKSFSFFFFSKRSVFLIIQFEHIALFLFFWTDRTFFLQIKLRSHSFCFQRKSPHLLYHTFLESSLVFLNTVHLLTK